MFALRLAQCYYRRKLHGRWRRSIYHIVCYLKFFKPIGQQARISRSDHILRILNNNKCFVCFNRRLTGRDSRVSHELIRTRPREGAARRFYVNIIKVSTHVMVLRPRRMMKPL